MRGDTHSIFDPTLPCRAPAISLRAARVGVTDRDRRPSSFQRQHRLGADHAPGSTSLPEPLDDAIVSAERPEASPRLAPRRPASPWAGPCRPRRHNRIVEPEPGGSAQPLRRYRSPDGCRLRDRFPDHHQTGRQGTSRTDDEMARASGRSAAARHPGSTDGCGEDLLAAEATPLHRCKTAMTIAARADSRPDTVRRLLRRCSG